MAEALARLSPRRRRTLKVVGGLLLGGGVGLFFTGFIGFALAGQARVASFGQSGADPVSFWILGAIALPFIFVGAVLLKFGIMKPVSEIVATQTAGAVEHSSAAWGRGVGRGLRESGILVGARSGGGAVVKVKCRACGFLETEDARFCSRCAKPM